MTGIIWKSYFCIYTCYNGLHIVSWAALSSGLSEILETLKVSPELWPTYDGAYKNRLNRILKLHSQFTCRHNSHFVLFAILCLA